MHGTYVSCLWFLSVSGYIFLEVCELFLHCLDLEVVPYAFLKYPLLTI